MHLVKAANESICPAPAFGGAPSAQGEEVAAREAPRQFRNWGPSDCKIPLAKHVFLGETVGMGGVKGARPALHPLRCIHRVRAGFAPKTTRTSAQGEPGTTLEAGISRQSCWQMLLAAAGPRTATGTRHPQLPPQVSPSCTGSRAGAPTGRRCLSSP